MSNKTVDLVTKDYEGFRQQMIDLIPKYAPEWTDTSQSDFGIVLIELLANGLDILSYYQDKNFNESFLATARTRKAVVRLCKMLGYELSAQTPALHTITFTKDPNFLDEEIVIPKGTQISTDPRIGAEVVFELLDGDVILPAGVSTATATATHGQTVDDSMLGTSDGTEFQRFIIPYPDVLADRLMVSTVENGREVIWERVTDYLSSEQGDRHYLVEVNESNEMTIQFGNGLSGLIPTKGATIVANYRVGGGEIGNVGTGTINTFANSEIAGITFSNTELYLRGEDVESIEHAKMIAPRAYRNSGRTVTKRDFEDSVMNIEGVAKARCIETFNANGDLNIYVVPNNYGEFTQGLRDKIMDNLNSTKLVHDNPILFDTDYTEFDITLQLTTYQNYFNQDVSDRVEVALINYFDPLRMDFGVDVYLSTIIGEVMRVVGVKNVIVNAPLTDVLVPENSVARLINVNIVTTGGIDA